MQGLYVSCYNALEYALQSEIPVSDGVPLYSQNVNHRGKIVMQILPTLLRSARDVFRTEGLIPLLKRGFTLGAHYFLSFFFEEYATVHLYETDISDSLKGKIEADFAPILQNLTCRVVFSNQEADEMAASGLEFRSYNSVYREWLDKGAIAYCFFVDKEFAHIVWVATSEEAKKAIDPLPYKVDFANNEVCISEVWTNPKYRGKGLMKYSLFKGSQILKERGILRSRACIPINKMSTQRAAAMFDAKRYAERRYVRILWWKFWREKPITPDSHRS